MDNIQGIVVEVKCESCSGNGMNKGAFMAYVVCQKCQGYGVVHIGMPLADFKKLLSDTETP